MEKLGQKSAVPLVYRIVGRNLRHRLARTILSALAISISVTLMLTIVGIRDAKLNDQRVRARGAGADLMIFPAGANVIGFAGAPLSDKLTDFVGQQPHVEIATGAVMQSIGGVNRITGIDYARFDEMANFVFVDGGPFENPDDVVIDEYYAIQHDLTVGSTTEMLEREWRVVGIVEPGKMARVIVPIDIVQELTGTEGKLTMIFVKLDDPALTYEIIDELEGVMGTEDYQFYSVEEFASQFTADAIPGVKTFMNVIVGLCVAFGFLVVFLTMHTAILERTREIGILKSLGAARSYILGILVRESLSLGFLGAVIGIVSTFGSVAILNYTFPADVPAVVVVGWWPIAIGVSLVGSLMGALYPAIQASRQDALASLSYD